LFPWLLAYRDVSRYKTHRCRRVFARGIALNLASRRCGCAKEARRLFCAFIKEGEHKFTSSTRCSTRDSQGYRGGRGSGAGRDAQDGSFTIQADLATRSKNVAADPLSDRFYSSLLAPSWPISRTWTTLVRSLSRLLGLRSPRKSRNSSSSRQPKRLLSVTLHLILRALHRARHFYAAAMTSARQKRTKGTPWLLLDANWPRPP